MNSGCPCLLLCGRLYFPKIVTAISSFMYTSRTFHSLPLPNEEEVAIVFPLLKWFQWLEYDGRR